MPPVSGFVERLGSQLLLNGSRFPIAGGNTYYLAYVDEATQNSVLDLAAEFGFNVLRVWSFLDGDPPLCFQYWDPEAAEPRIQEGENGLLRLDRAIANAGQRGIRLILALTNYWKDFGGMPKYLEWYGLEPGKNLFYTDPRCRAAYRNWVTGIVTRRNTITGRLYSDEPAILAWDLANEPRPEGWFAKDPLVGWIAEMSAFLHSLDANHLIAAGDEGTTPEILQVPNLDLATLHIYPKTSSDGLDQIRRQAGRARAAALPLLLEEYGIQAQPGERNATYQEWLNTVRDLDLAGALVWMTGLPKSASQPYDPDPYVLFSVDQAPAVREYVLTELLGQ